MPKALYSIVGQKHRGTEGFINSLPEGKPLILRREPTNPYDKRAVQVIARGQHVGYIPSKHNTGLAMAMDGKPAFADELGSGKAARLVFSASSRYPQVEVDE